MNQIIVKFSEINDKTLIKPSEIHKFSLELYQKKEIPYKLSYDFWRKEKYLGKKLIEKTNKTFELSMIDTKLVALHDIDSSNIREVNDDEIKTKKELIRLTEEIEIYKQEISLLKFDIYNLNENLLDLKEKNKKYRDTLFSLMASSIYSEDSFFDVLNGRPIDQPIVRKLLDIHFGNEKDLEFELRTYMIELLKESNTKNENIISFESRIAKMIRENQSE